MMLCSFVIIVLCIGNIYYVFNFLYMCKCIYWIMYWYIIFCIVCVVYWFILNCCVIWFEFINFLFIDCFMYFGLYCNFSVLDKLIFCCIGYICIWLCIVCVENWFILCIYIGVLLCIMCFGYILLYIYVYCLCYLLFICLLDGGFGVGIFLCLSFLLRFVYGILLFRVLNNFGLFWYKKIESYYCVVDSWYI